jgi:hypothetical protein
MAFEIRQTWTWRSLQDDRHLGTADRVSGFLGAVSEFEGLGLKAKFRNLGAETAIKAAAASDLATTSEQANPADFFKEVYWAFRRPYYVLTDSSAKIKEKPDELDQEAVLHIATAIRNSIICGRFSALIVLDNDRKPVGFFRRDQFLELLRIVLVGYNGIQVDPEAAFRQVAGSELGVILKYPVIRAKSPEASRDTVPGSEDIESAYKKMIAANSEIALITDRLGRFDGIITRAAIEGRIIEGLLAASK